MKILYNAQIHSFDQFRQQASVLVIDRDKIAALGGPELFESFGARASREDMGGRVILPGLTDAHIHLLHYALSLQKVDVETSSKAEALQRVAERASKTPRGEWVFGHGWQQNDWDGEFPTAAELDAVAPEHPVYLTSKSLHASWANTLVLQLAGIGPGTPDPVNGKILRNPSGLPTGILLETAVMLVEKILPSPDDDKASQVIEAALPNLWKLGLTGAHDFDHRSAFMGLQILDRDQRLKLRVTKSIPLDLLPQAAALGLRTGFGSEHLRIGSVKVFMDGALGPRTAAMLTPYLNEPENRGILNMDGEQFYEHGKLAADAGLSMTGHAIGDRALHEILDGYEQLRGYERDHGLPALRHRIEHVQVLHPNDARRLGKLGVIASMQPIHATSDMLAAEKYWGARVNLAYSWRTQLDAGAILAFGSDAPVEAPNPFWGLHAAITRRRPDGTPGLEGWHPEQRLTVREALEGYTTGAAYAAGREDQLGRLSPGHYADLIVLEKDPFNCHPDDLLTMHSAGTMLGGEWLWQA
ncbi:MAG TPA: amidohydrolase [Anaerolineales bacterium]